MSLSRQETAPAPPTDSRFIAPFALGAFAATSLLLLARVIARPTVVPR